MTTALYTHAAFLQHDTGPGHPERIQRLAAVLHAVKAPEFDAVKWREAPLAEIAQIERVHDAEYVRHALAAVPDDGWAQLDGDTVLSPGSGEAALRAAGAVTAAVGAVLKGEFKNAFCAVRPPGHHAERDGAMGFCIFNNVAIGAAEARVVHGLERVAVMDFDVHHGNGTQHIFDHDPSVFFASTHQMPLYPGTGAMAERGVGNICNVPLPPGAGSEEFRAAMEKTVLPAIEAFRPELILISAGFDAHRRDPLASLDFETEDYHWATERLCALAAACCDGRVVSTLEGGYDLAALGESAAAHLAALLEA
ncbi:histone deacetylase family protein [Dongia sedimenti]|uniref:Histone deacetylase family protein n=1 Tax=Dongia sedimenti TaxID=3064282 RepID=A0ABU0YJ72_9PROT|nr:histone deacetylase family protein [Rhodospirillaceae bacterium R-7]